MNQNESFFGKGILPQFAKKHKNMKKICKNCRYSRFDYTKKREIIFNYSSCKCKKFIDDMNYKGGEKRDTLKYWGTEKGKDFAGSFQVEENFGCIHFVKKDYHWLCLDCAKKSCKGHPYFPKSFYNIGATWHDEICNHCGEKKSVTEIDNFGGLKEA